MDGLRARMLHFHVPDVIPALTDGARTASARVTMPSSWTPASLLALRQYSRSMLARDMVAGVTVGLVALPLAMAFAIASGPHAAGRHLLRDRHRLHHLRPRRIEVPDRRPDRRLRRRRRRHRRRLRRQRPVHVHDDGRRHPGRAGRDRHGHRRSSTLPRPVVVGFTNGIAVLIASTQIKRLPRPAGSDASRRRSSRGSERSRRTATRSRPAPRLLASARWCCILVLRAVAAARSRHHRRAGGRHGRRVVLAVCRSRRSAPRFGGIPSGLPALALPAIRAVADSDAALAGAHRGACSARSNR